MGHRKSIIRATLDRLDDLMALGESRGRAKEDARARGESTWGFSTGKIHSYKTRQVYQEQILHFVNWARDEHAVRRLEELDELAVVLCSLFLQARLDEGKSASTLHTIRSALRLFFANPTLMEEVSLPKRSRETITRSRGPKKSDRHFQPDNWQPLITFLSATGLRRNEVARLQIGEILESTPEYDGPAILVRQGKGGKERTVPVLPGHEQEVLQLKRGRQAQERVFSHIPVHLDVHAYRRAFAQAYYLHLVPGRTLPPATGRLRPTDYDRAAIEQVTRALGHNRIDVVLRHYLR